MIITIAIQETDLILINEQVDLVLTNENDRDDLKKYKSIESRVSKV